jgi:hypothetical protein
MRYLCLEGEVVEYRSVFTGRRWEEVPSAYRVWGQTHILERLLRDTCVDRSHAVLDGPRPPSDDGTYVEHGEMSARDLKAADIRAKFSRPWSGGSGKLTDRAQRELKVHPLHGPARVPVAERRAQTEREQLKGLSKDKRSAFVLAQLKRRPPENPLSEEAAEQLQELAVIQKQMDDLRHNRELMSLWTYVAVVAGLYC